MTVLSKSFDEQFSNVRCQQIVHPNVDSCIEAAIIYFFQPLPTIAKFFIPLFLISICSKRDKIDRAFLISKLKYFVSSVLTGFLTITFTTLFMCGSYNLFHRIKYFTLILYPSIAANLVIFLIPNKIAVMFAHSASVMLIELFVRNGNFIIFNWKSILFRTFCFMLLSGMMLDSMFHVKPEITWFFQPSNLPRKNDDDHSNEDRKCSHELNCSDFMWKEVKMYFKIGFGIELVRNAIQYFVLLKSKPLKGIWNCITSINKNFILFAVTYPCSYRMLTCLFNNFIDCDLSTANFVSAFVSGIFFYFYPNIPLFAHTLSCTLQIVWQRLLETKFSEKFPILSEINRIPFAGLTYTFGFAYLNHVRTFFPWQSSSFLKKAVNYGSNGLSDKMIINVWSILFGSQ